MSRGDLEGEGEGGEASPRSQVVASAASPKAELPQAPRPKLDATSIPEDSAPLVDLLTADQLEAHLASLDTSRDIVKKRLRALCLPIHKALWDHADGWIFHKRVDPERLNLPDYFDVIKRPMDLTTIRKKLEGNAYSDLEAFEADMVLMLENAKLYNGEGSEVYDLSDELLGILHSQLARARETIEKELEERRSQENVCPLCLQERLLFEPITYYCNGSSCSGRLRRNVSYFCHQDWKWCAHCYQELKDSEPIDLGGTYINKRQLERRKNDEVNEEPWVECDGCHRYCLR